MATAQEAKSCRCRALRRIEDRLAASPPAEESQRLAAAYDTLWVVLAGIDDDLLIAAADRVVAASRRLEQIVRSAGTMGATAYRTALTSATASAATALSGGQQTQPIQERSPAGSGTGNGPQPGSTSGANLWHDLIAAYRANTETRPHSRRHRLLSGSSNPGAARVR